MVHPYSYAGIKDFTATTVGPMLPEKQQERAQHIIDVVCNYYQTKRERIINKHREQPYVEIRHVCMLLIKEKTGMGYKNIGRIFKRDHTSVIFAVRKINELCEVDEYLKKCVTSLRMIL